MVKRLALSYGELFVLRLELAMCPKSMLVVSRNLDTALLQLVSLACGVTELPSKRRILVLL